MKCHICHKTIFYFHYHFRLILPPNLSNDKKFNKQKNYPNIYLIKHLAYILWNVNPFSLSNSITFYMFHAFPYFLYLCIRVSVVLILSQASHSPFALDLILSSCISWAWTLSSLPFPVWLLFSLSFIMYVSLVILSRRHNSSYWFHILSLCISLCILSSGSTT